MSLPTNTKEGPAGLEPLRRAFKAPTAPCPSPENCPEPDRIWAAAHGELEAEATRDIIDHTATCADCAEDWRLAREVGRAAEGDTPRQAPSTPETDGGRVLSMAHRFRRYTAPLAGLAAAAVILLMVGLPGDAPPPPEYRAGEADTIRSLLLPEASLPRDRCLLRWSEVDGARYNVVVSDARLTVLAEVPNLKQPSFQVPAESLASLSSGAELYWQVEAVLPDGSTRSSKTFIHRIE